MDTVISVLVLLALPTMLLLAVMYFTSLSHLVMLLENESPEVLERAKMLIPRSNMQLASAVLLRVRNGRFQDLPLTPAGVEACLHAKRLAQWFLSCFLVFMGGMLLKDWLVALTRSHA